MQPNAHLQRITLGLLFMYKKKQKKNKEIKQEHIYYLILTNINGTAAKHENAV